MVSNPIVIMNTCCNFPGFLTTRFSQIWVYRVSTVTMGSFFGSTVTVPCGTRWGFYGLEFFFGTTPPPFPRGYLLKTYGGNRRFRVYAF